MYILIIGKSFITFKTLAEVMRFLMALGVQTIADASAQGYNIEYNNTVICQGVA